jgi:hypothetical protein
MWQWLKTEWEAGQEGILRLIEGISRKKGLTANWDDEMCVCWAQVDKPFDNLPLCLHRPQHDNGLQVDLPEPHTRIGLARRPETLTEKEEKSLHEL